MKYRLKRGISVILAAAASLYFLVIFVRSRRVAEHPAPVTRDLRTEIYLDDTETTVSPPLPFPEFALMHICSGALCLQVPP